MHLVYSNVPSKLPFFLPFENGLDDLQWCCSHVTSLHSFVFESNNKMPRHILHCNCGIG